LFEAAGIGGVTLLRSFATAVKLNAHWPGQFSRPQGPGPQPILTARIGRR
jgi:hypothetical protein